MGGEQSRALNAVTTVITGVLGGQTDIQVAANTLAPYAAQQIGEKFGHGEDKNKAAQLASHAILGATLAYLNGGNPAAGGGAAVASEAAADYLANQYNDGKTAINPETGKFDANLLSENVKSSIRDLTAAIGAVVGGTVGDSKSNAQLAGVIGQNTVENNALITESPDGKSRYYTKEDNKFNLLQYLVATGQLTLDQVPNSIFEDMANRGYASLTEEDKAPNNASEEQKYRQNFVDGIKDGQIISEQKFSDLMNKNPEIWTEVKNEIETKQFWEGVKEPIFQYVLPGLQLVGGGVQIVGAGAIDVVGCATVAACGLAVGGSSLLVVNGLDDIRTGWNNLGVQSEGQSASSTLTSLGISEGTAEWIKLGAAGASIGAEAIAINKGVNASSRSAENVTQDVLKANNEPNISKANSGENVNFENLEYVNNGELFTGSIKNVNVQTLDQIPYESLNIDVIRSGLAKYVKSGNTDSISVASARIVLEDGSVTNLLSVSGKSWKQNSPSIVNINGVEYKVVTSDSGSLGSINVNGKTNTNHAELKLGSYISDNFGKTYAKVDIAVQNTSTSKPGMCTGCGNNVPNLGIENSNLDLTIYHGSTGKNP
ncbi:VENN motif pre-toxin domain-containing protein [Acinetobacter seifertii]|nr:VENN motif pre-toxin domain-containing protein [Acinetobacter seifertii]MCG8284442.1 VENN motif pre-toxin domain-containing protein [Acinetobacter seifertii]